MALVKFGFAFEIDPDLFDKAVMAKAMESSIFEKLSQSNYGDGVKNIAIGVIVQEAKHARVVALRRPVYTPGKRKARNLPVELEDTLEFDIKPQIEEVRNATTEAHLAESIRRSLGFVFPALLELQIPNFAMDRFIADLDRALKSVAATKAL